MKKWLGFRSNRRSRRLLQQGDPVCLIKTNCTLNTTQSRNFRWDPATTTSPQGWAWCGWTLTLAGQLHWSSTRTNSSDRSRWSTSSPSNRFHFELISSSRSTTTVCSFWTSRTFTNPNRSCVRKESQSRPRRRCWIIKKISIQFLIMFSCARMELSGEECWLRYIRAGSKICSQLIFHSIMFCSVRNSLYSMDQKQK